MRPRRRLFLMLLFVTAAALGVYYTISRNTNESIRNNPSRAESSASPSSENALAAQTQDSADYNTKRISTDSRFDRKPARAAGRFVDSAGRPVANVSIWRLLPESPLDKKQSAPEPDRSEPTVKSNDRGEFVWSENLTDWESNSIFMIPRTLVAMRAGFERVQFEASLREGETTQIRDITIPPGGELSGIVTNSAAAPIEHAVVHIYNNSKAFDDEGDIRLFGAGRLPVIATTSDKNGNFTIAGVGAGELRAVAFRDGTNYSFSPPLLLTGGGNITDIKLILEPASPEASIEGEVRAPDGSPCEAIVSAVANFDGIYQYKTDRSGKFSHKLRSFQPWTFTARDANNKIGYGKVEKIKPGARNVIIQLSKSRMIEFECKSDSGELLVSARAALAGGIHYFEYDAVGAESLAPGGILQIAAPPGEFVLRLDADGYEPVELRDLDSATMPERTTVIFTKRHPIRGRVFADGAPRAGVKIKLYGEMDGRFVCEGFRLRVFPSIRTDAVVSDANGKFTIFPDGPYPLAYLRASASPVRDIGDYDVEKVKNYPAFADAEVGPFLYDPKTGVDDITIHLTTGGRLTGKVILPDGIRPGTFLIVASRGDRSCRFARPDASGNYQIDRLTPGRYVIKASTDDFLTLPYYWNSRFVEPAVDEDSSICEVRDGEASIYNIDLRDGIAPKVEGILQFGSVTFSEGTVRLQTPFDDPNFSPPVARLNSDGSYQITAPAMRAYYLLFSTKLPNGENIKINDCVALFAAGTAIHNIIIPAGRVEGRLAPGIDPAKSKIEYSFRGEVYSISAGVAVAADGTFVIDPAPAGKLIISRPYESQVDVQVEAGKTATVEVK